MKIDGAGFAEKFETKFGVVRKIEVKAKCEAFKGQEKVHENAVMRGKDWCTLPHTEYFGASSIACVSR